MKPRVLLADDHVLMMEGLQSLLAGHVELVGSAVDGRALVDAAMSLPILSARCNQNALGSHGLVGTGV